MLKLYITKVISDALLYFDDLDLNIQQRVNKNKDLNIKKQIITAQLLLKYALKEIGYKDEIVLEYTPKPILKNSRLHISKSHSDLYVLVAVSDLNVGADIEKIRKVKTPEKLLAKEELENYNKTLTDEDKNKVFMMYWTLKESFIKYHGTLIKSYQEIEFKIIKTINGTNIFKIDDLLAYQSTFSNYSFACISEKDTYPEVIFVNEKDIKGKI